MQASKIHDILALYNRFWSTGMIDAGIERDCLDAVMRQVDSKEVVVLQGARRSGKSTLMAQVVRKLLKNGFPPEGILRVNLEEPLLATEYSIELLEQIYRTYRERVMPEGRCVLFLDEVQNIDGWESWVRGRNETEDMKIFLTGSSARLLSREIGSRLTGRHVTFEIYPLSFREFLRFNGIEISSENDYLVRKAVVRNMLREYLRHGGFPEIVLKKETPDKLLLLKSYFEDIVFRDVAARHDIRDASNLMNLAVYLFTNIARKTSVNKLKNNFSISQDKTENYVSAIMESYLLLWVKKFSYSLKNVHRSGFKPYAVDTGLRNRVAFSFSEDLGWLMENLVFLHLKRHGEEVFFDSNGGETDFVVKRGTRIARRIQVWYDDAENRTIPDRELKGFEIQDEHRENAECILVTNDLEDTVEVGSTPVRCVPAAKFFLFDES